jgi:hypothetical protein
MTTFKQLVNDERGTIYIDRREGDMRFVILKGGYALCAYVGAPKSHPLHIAEKIKLVERKLDNDSGYREIEINCHYGLTYGPGSLDLDDDWLFYGWDYGHAGDRLLMDFHDIPLPFIMGKGIEWTPEMVERDSQEAIADFKRLMNKAEEAEKSSRNIRGIEFE